MGRGERLHLHFFDCLGGGRGLEVDVFFFLFMENVEGGGGKGLI